MFRVIVIPASGTGSVHIRGVPRIFHCWARLKGSGGSRGRRLGQLPRAPREGHRRRESNKNGSLHDEKRYLFYHFK